jgi:Transposase IS116/IS110/IS902 family
VLEQEFRAVEKRLSALARSDAPTRRLMTTPGVGAIVALTFAAAIDDPARFRSSRMLRCTRVNMSLNISYRATEDRLVRLSPCSYGRGISEMDQIGLHSLQKALAAAVVLCCTATVTPAFADKPSDRNMGSSGLGYANGRGGSVGAPGPIAGAGLPFLALAGAYALVRRRRNRNRPE